MQLAEGSDLLFERFNLRLSSNRDCRMSHVSEEHKTIDLCCFVIIDLQFTAEVPRPLAPRPYCDRCGVVSKVSTSIVHRRRDKNCAISTSN